MNLKRVLVISAALVTAAFLLTACSGNEDSTASPEMRAALQRVDEAIVDSSYDQAESALEELKQVALEERAAGTLGAKQTDDILQAVSQLLADLRATSDETANSNTTDGPSTVAPEPEEEKPEKEPKDKKGHGDKPKGKPDHQGGPGNSENAPGHDDD